MTQPPQWGETISYQSRSQYGNAAVLVKLAGIFNLVAAGLDALCGLAMAGFVVLMVFIAAEASRPGAPAGPGHGGAGTRPEEAWMVAGVYGGLAVLSLGVSVVKAIGGTKMLRHSPGAWGWGLAAGIVGCVQLWCSLACVVPMSAGIYTIIILCLDHVRRFLADPVAR